MMCIFCYCACKLPFPPTFFSIPRKWKEEFIDFTSSSILLLPSSGKMGGASMITQNIFNGGNISVMLTYWLFIMYGWTFSPYVDGWMDWWMDGWMGGYMCVWICMHVCMYVCMCVFTYVCAWLRQREDLIRGGFNTKLYYPCTVQYAVALVAWGSSLRNLDYAFLEVCNVSNQNVTNYPVFCVHKFYKILYTSKCNLWLSLLPRGIS